MDKLMKSIARSCAVAGCGSPSGFYGVCLGHEPQFVRDEFQKITGLGLASVERPSCYETHRKWMEYVVAFVYSSASNRRDAVRIEHCRDCTPEYRDEQTELDRCEHPETVFVMPDTNNGGVVGVPMKNPKDPRRWEQAMMGMLGTVVSLPKSSAMDKAMRLSASQKKKIGRPKRSSDE